MSKDIIIYTEPTFVEFINTPVNQLDKNYFIIKGSAGTGKTTQVKQIVDNIRNCIVVSFTNKAVNVLKRKKIKAYTIHSAFFKVVDTGKTKIVLHPDLDPITNLIKIDDKGAKIYIEREEPVLEFLFSEDSLHTKGVVGKHVDLRDVIVIVDEGSLVPSTQWSLLLNQFSGKLVIIGDDKQLPPVELEFAQMKKDKKDVRHIAPYIEFFHKTKADVTLTKVHRQGEHSAIKDVIATVLHDKGRYPFPYNPGGGDAVCFNPTEARGNPLQNKNFLSCIFDADVVVVWTNIARAYVNSVIRKHLFGHLYEKEPVWRNGLPRTGDKLTVDKSYNEYHTDKDNKRIIINQVSKGEDLVVVEILDDNIDIDNGIAYATVKNFDGEVYNVSLRLDAFGHKTKKGFSAMSVSYGYAVTCHKSQGSEYEVVTVIDDVLLSTADRTKWMYTAVTRPSEVLYVIKFPDFSNIIRGL